MVKPVPVETGSPTEGHSMSRRFLTPLLAAAFLAAPTLAPNVTIGLSGSALAEKATTPTTNAKHLNTSRSNIYRATKSRSTSAAEGTTIPRCPPSGSGDPLKGLNVHKASTSAAPKGPGCVPW